MDMHGGVISLLNSHSWYHIDSPLDYVRAALWCLSNLVTATAYLLIPNEIRQWRTVLPFASTSLILNLFIAFIAFCGLSHLAMLAIMQTGPWWATLFIYVPMAAVSAATVTIIRIERRLILELLENVARALKEKPS